jgi:uncharacterized protein with PIN domain
MNALGKLKKTLKDKCPDCKRNLQVRILQKSVMDDGEMVSVDDEFIVCPECGCMGAVEKKRKRNGNS